MNLCIKKNDHTCKASFSYEFLHRLYQDYPESNLFGRVAVEEYFVLREKRELSLLTDNATERYKNYLKNNLSTSN